MNNYEKPSTDSYKYPTPVENQYELSENEKLLLEQEGLAVKAHVPQTGFINTEHFKERSNNFFMFFESSFLSEQVYRSTNAYKRFELLYEELANQLKSYYLVANTILNRNGYGDTVFASHIEDFYRAYKIMTELVDANDAGVARVDENGNTTYDNWALCR